MRGELTKENISRNILMQSNKTMEIDMRMFHKITVAYPIANGMDGEQTFCLASETDARSFRAMVEEKGYKIVLHTFDNLLSCTDALMEIESDIQFSIEVMHDMEEDYRELR